MIQIKSRHTFLVRTAGWVLSAAVCWPAVVQAQVNTDLPTITLHAGMHNIHAEVAQTEAQREIGLMNRSSLPGNNGMLFVFEQKSAYCFWMKNTRVPLTIAFVADDGTVVNLADMAPQSEESHCAKAPVRYALEMSQGWFARRGISAGTRLTGAPFVTQR